VIVSDNIPSNFEYINATLDGNPIPNLSSNPYTFNVGKFTPSTTRSLVITVRAISSGDTINFATINGTYGDNSSISSKDSNNVSVKVLGAPQMSVSKEQNVTSSVEPGELIKYTITVNNLQNVTSYNVNITDQIPQYTDFNRTNDTACTYNSSTGIVNCTKAQMLGLEIWNIEIVVKVTSNATSVTNTANLTWMDGLNNNFSTTNTTTPINVKHPNVTISKEIKTPVKSFYAPGDAIIYQVNIKNIGDGTAYNVNVTD
ncbi:MAG: hypothetical protein CVT88_02405, partial [Candidatus Altiarchaeales archaeon HGW-Altiarchaeales-1]